jgi:hypothetical protein
MYFNNRATALSNQVTLATAMHKSRTFDELQATTAMFLMTMVSNAESDAHGWVQNELRGITGPADRCGTGALSSIIDAVRRTLQGCGPQAASGNSFMLVDDELRKDIRFEQCPVGSVVMFRGVLDYARWGLKADMTKRAAIPGWFISPEEFVVNAPELAGSYLQGTTRWHGSEYLVGYLRQRGEPLKLMNRPLSETYALAETYHHDPSDIRTVWLYPGMRFELLPDGAPRSRILTPPEDTQPHRVIVARHGAVEYLHHMLAPTLSTLSTAWAMTDLPNAVNNDGDYKSGGISGAAALLCEMLGHIPGVHLGFNELNKALAVYGCRVGRDSCFEGSDGKTYRWKEFMRRFSYGLGRADNIATGTYGRLGNIVYHQSYLLGVMACIEKYKLPRELLLSMYLEILPNDGAHPRNPMLCKLKSLCTLDIDVMTAMEKMGNRSEPEGQALWDLCADAFAESRIARSRATYHADLSTGARKKVLARFYPAV